ncbi:uncharacterized protein LY79DRAFT_662756 [Colletotrichum navitas]|uniref:Uncharacterized protein n=1 Tax=Colletotrichum navitas TaxID=681940 RepID=A0AAD8UZS1_9PEZI|nr:uncharacterized protein LY79DRAFT_662756 [Colletotrichum navitas]KAK1573478.1 hypothetical protein LY79DRAFT_662756 [Colletotrichum navitas]
MRKSMMATASKGLLTSCSMNGNGDAPVELLLLLSAPRQTLAVQLAVGPIAWQCQSREKRVCRREKDTGLECEVSAHSVGRGGRRCGCLSRPSAGTCVLPAAGQVIQARHPAAATTTPVAVAVVSPLFLKFDHPLRKRFEAPLKLRDFVREVGRKGLEMMHRGRVVYVNSD